MKGSYQVRPAHSMRSWRVIAVVLAVGLGVALAATADVPAGPESSAPVPSGTRRTDRSFSFSAAGDYSSGSDTSETLKGIAHSGASFNLALGDLSYGKLRPESAWCNYVKQTLGELPVEVVAGNHDDDGEPPGQHIDGFASCLPDRLDSVGQYGRQYYFDYPASDPIARFILVSPEERIDGSSWSYRAGSARYNWVRDVIDAARGAGISWIIVGMHFPCISLSSEHCDMGVDLFRLLVGRKVDLILTGHEHNYQRTKQLVQDVACPQFKVGTFDDNCVGDQDVGANYRKSLGTIQITIGTAGVAQEDVDFVDREAGYFSSA